VDSDHQLLNSTSPNHSLGLIQRLWARAPLAWFLLGAFWFVYLQVFILPFVPISFWADQSTYLLNARRMLDGQVIYRDFFQFTPPGTESVYFGLFRLFGPRSWIPDGMLLLLGVSLVGLITMISEKLINGASCFLPGLLFLVIPFQSLLDGTHHWYSTVAVMAALAVVIENRSVFRLAAAGTLCGLATCFTQSRGLVAVLGLAVVLLWERRCLQRLFRRKGWPATIPGLHHRFRCEVLSREWFNTWRVYMADAPSLHSISALLQLPGFLFIHALLPLVYVLFFARYWRAGRAEPQEPWDKLMLVNLL